MSIELINDLNVNHIGIVIPLQMQGKIEDISQQAFIKDKIQGVSVCFVWDEEMKIYREYITQEGRAKDYPLGYNHICYDIESLEKMGQLHKNILKSKLGVRLTLPDPSPTKQCNIVTFYKLTGLGIFEFNILD